MQLLKLIFEEYSKLELDPSEAKDNALQDEKRCLERSRSKKPLYVNAVVKCVQNLRSDKEKDGEIVGGTWNIKRSRAQLTDQE